MLRSKRTWIFMAAALAAALAIPPAGLRASDDDIRFFTIGTGAGSSTYFLTGALLANLISNPPGSRECERGGSCGVPGLIAVAQSTQGSVENMNRVGAGKLDSALSRANVANWAYNGTWIFEGRTASENLRAIGNLYPETVHIVVRADSGIESIPDLKGRKMSLGEEKSGTRFETLIILGHFGLTVDDIEPVYATPGHAADLLEAGEIDALVEISVDPAVSIAELAKRVPIRILPIDEATAIEFVGNHPFFITTSILIGAYEGVPLTPTLGIGTIWVTSAGIDDETVYRITRALWHENNRDLLVDGHPQGRFIHESAAVGRLGIPLHPGAARYYRERGLIE